MVLADPGFIVAQVVQPPHQLQVTVDREGRVLADPMEGPRNFLNFIRSGSAMRLISSKCKWCADKIAHP